MENSVYSVLLKKIQSLFRRGKIWIERMDEQFSIGLKDLDFVPNNKWMTGICYIMGSIQCDIARQNIDQVKVRRSPHYCQYNFVRLNRADLLVRFLFV
jgi:hypothetical protein